MVGEPPEEDLTVHVPELLRIAHLPGRARDGMGWDGVRNGDARISLTKLRSGVARGGKGVGWKA